ncbi:hypothetical protein JHK87_004536 [Glycine soja]|nr:hypothetical protein JHK87_004536 [Glycine soja]
MATTLYMGEQIGVGPYFRHPHDVWESHYKKTILPSLPFVIAIGVCDCREVEHPPLESDINASPFHLSARGRPLPLTANLALGGHSRKVLVVQERHCSQATLGIWKIPTRFILQAEEIAAVRVVKEETGANSQFFAPIELANGLVEFSPLVVVVMSKSSLTHGNKFAVNLPQSS